MAQDVRAGYDKAAASTPMIKSVIPVGEAWVRRCKLGLRIPTRTTALSRQG
jgi:hypothetical protein